MFVHKNDARGPLSRRGLVHPAKGGDNNEVSRLRQTRRRAVHAHIIPEPRSPAMAYVSNRCPLLMFQT